MKLTSTIVWLIIAIALIALALFGFGPGANGERGVAARNKLEQLAFQKSGSEELKGAVSELRLVEKNLAVAESLRWAVEVAALVAASVALGLCVRVARKKRLLVKATAREIHERRSGKGAGATRPQVCD